MGALRPQSPDWLAREPRDRQVTARFAQRIARAAKRRDDQASRVRPMNHHPLALFLLAPVACGSAPPKDAPPKPQTGGGDGAGAPHGDASGGAPLGVGGSASEGVSPPPPPPLNDAGAPEAS